MIKARICGDLLYRLRASAGETEPAGYAAVPSIAEPFVSG
jgi:hypothetical protein